MASKYNIATANWNDNTAWSSSSGGANDVTAPTAADDVFLDANSGNVTIAAAAACRSINCTGYTGTLTHNSAITLSIGDGTAGASNVALLFVAGMTYTLGSATTSAISFISTSATVQSVNFASKTTGNVTYNGTSGSWQLAGVHNTGSTATVTLTDGTLDTNGQTCSWGSLNTTGSGTKVLILGASAITITGNNISTQSIVLVSSATLTVNAGTSSLTFTSTSYKGINLGSGHTINEIVTTIGGLTRVDYYPNTSTINTLTINGPANVNSEFRLNGALTVNTSLTIAGNSSTNRVLIASGTLGTARTITSASNTISNADFIDITGAGAGSWNLSAITGGSGDCGGNSGITFTTAAAKYWVGNGGNWSDPGTHWATSSGGAAGAGNIPLPQDDVNFDSNSFSSGSQTVTADMPRLGKSINWTGATNSPTFALTSTGNTIYGSLTLISGMTLSSTQTFSLGGRGSFTLTSAGKTFGGTVNIEMVGGTMTLQDAFINTSRLALNAGTFDANDFNVTIRDFISNLLGSGGSFVNTLNMGNGTWTLTRTSNNVWEPFFSSSITINSEGSTINISDTGSSSKTFVVRDHVYNKIEIASGGSGVVIINPQTTGTPTVGTLTINAPKSVRFTAAQTLTISSAFNAVGTSGNVITIESSSAGSAATLSKSSGEVICDYLSLKDSTATGGATWYAGSNSTNVSGNTGWLFEDPPAGSTNFGQGAFGDARFGAQAFGQGAFA